MQDDEQKPGDAKRWASKGRMASHCGSGCHGRGFERMGRPGLSVGSDAHGQPCTAFSQSRRFSHFRRVAGGISCVMSGLVVCCLRSEWRIEANEQPNVHTFTTFTTLPTLSTETTTSKLQSSSQRTWPSASSPSQISSSCRSYPGLNIQLPDDDCPPPTTAATATGRASFLSLARRPWSLCFLLCNRRQQVSQFSWCAGRCTVERPGISGQFSRLALITQNVNTGRHGWSQVGSALCVIYLPDPSQLVSTRHTITWRMVG